MPSMTYSGSLLPRMDVMPRMRTARPPSAVRVTVTPGNRPMRTFSIGSPGVRWMSSEVTVAVCAGLVRLVPLEWVHPERIPTLRPTRSRAREGSEGMGNLRGWRWQLRRNIRAWSWRGIWLGVSVTLLAASAAAQNRVQVASPDGRNRVTVEVRDGALFYSVQRDGRAVLLPSRLGFALQGAAPLRDGLRLVDTTTKTVDDTWTQPWGEAARLRGQHNELRVSAAEAAAPARQFVVVFRVFNDGVGFRYGLPEQRSE